MRVLLKFSHGLGDGAQFTCVLQHLAKRRPDWVVDVASKLGKHSAFHGLCRRSWVLDRDTIPEQAYQQVFDLGWYECYSVYSDSPCTKVCNCLREVFGIIPDPALLKYRIEIGPESHQKALSYLSTICDTAFRRVAQRVEAASCRLTVSPSATIPAFQNRNLGKPGQPAQDQRRENGDPFPVVAIHYEGNTSADKKNLPHELVADLCREILEQGYVPLVLDWDRRSPLPDQTTIFCPAVGPGDIWDNIGTGDAERLAALVSHCALFIGVDSGPLHVAGATQTPTLGVWTGHSPLQFFDLCPNVTHLVPDRWRSIPPCQNCHAARYFSEHYAYRVYQGPDGLKSTLIEAALESLAAGASWGWFSNLPVNSSVGSVATSEFRREAQPSAMSPAGEKSILNTREIRAPPRDAASRNGIANTTRLSSIRSRFPHEHDSFDKETHMSTAATLAWQLLPGLAHEISLGGDGSAFCLGMGEMPSGGYSIHHWNGTDWDHVEGAADKLAAGPDGRLWAIDRAQRVLRSSSAGWEALPGLAREIAVGTDGSAWCVSAGDFAPGGGSIHVWNGHDWSHVDGAAVKIAVGPGGQPWIVNSAGNVFRRSGEGWELLPGLAREIAIGADGSVWCLSAAAAASVDSSIHIWNGHDWEHVPGGAVKIAAGAPGALWLVNAEHQIFYAK